MSRRGENIWHRKDGRWEGRYVKDRINGRAVYGYVYAKTYKEVKKLQQMKIRECDVRKGTERDILMNNLFDLFLENRKRDVKESTFSKYYRDINNHLKPYWGKLKLSEISNLKIEKYTEYLLSEGNIYTGKALSSKTVKDVVVLLNSTLKYANRMNLVNFTNSCSSAPKVRNKAIQVLQFEEQKVFEKYLLNNTNPVKLGVFLCLYTGLRIGELCALQWKNISIENETLYIDSTIQRASKTDGSKGTKVIISSPKSECSGRYIPLFSGLANCLKSYFDTDAEIGNHYFLTNTEKYIEPRNLYKMYQKYLKDCGLPKYTFHCLRHTFATRAIECGCDAKTLSEILGHSNVKITLDRYVHPNYQLRKKQMELLLKIF